MRVGVGMPNTISGVDGRSMLEWARRAEAGPFTSLGVLDRIPYESFEPFITLAAAAAAASRVRRRGGAGPRGVDRLRSARPPGLVRPGLLRPRRRRGRGGALSPRLLRLHRPVRGEDRRGQPDHAASHRRLRPGLRGGRLRRAGAAADPGQGGAARPPGRGAGVTMRMSVLGAGPAGLYFSLLAKKTNPSH